VTTERRIDLEIDESIQETVQHLHVVEPIYDIQPPERSELYAKIGSVSHLRTSKEPDIVIESDNVVRLAGGEVILADDRLFVFNALLKNLGTPLRAEELRREGFSDRATISDTRYRFKRAIDRLRNDLNEKSEADVIEKHGTTKGTRYHMPQSVQFADRRKPETKDQSEYVRRNRIVNELSALYHDHPYVLERLHKYENPDFKPPHMGQDEIGTYTAYLGKYRLLSALEEVELFTDIDNGIVAYDSGIIGSEEEPSREILDLVAARQIAFNTNIRLAFKLAMKKWRYKGTMSEMDVVHEANFGLSMAIARMDVSRGYKFSTYATPWIKQATNRALADQSREIRIPAHTQEKFVKVSGILHKKASELNRDLTEAEICEYSGMSLNEYRDLMRRGKLHLVSLNKFVDDSHETELGDLLPPDDTYDDRNNDNFEATDTITSLIGASTLTDIEKFVLAMRYGVGNIFPRKLCVENKFRQSLCTSDLLEGSQGTEQTLADLGKLLGRSAERIRHIEAKALKKLQSVAPQLS
jgi:RNA polymerase primary sigma factor